MHADELALRHPRVLTDERPAPPRHDAVRRESEDPNGAPQGPPGPLEPRSEAILRAIIEEYVATAQPVGSQALVSRVPPGRQPCHRAQRHGRAGGGRLPRPPAHQRRPHPTDAGYRLYVESITDAVSLAPVEQLMIRHQFGQVDFASEQWFRLAAATLAAATARRGHRDRRQAAVLPRAAGGPRAAGQRTAEPGGRARRGAGQAGARSRPSGRAREGDRRSPRDCSTELLAGRSSAGADAVHARLEPSELPAPSDLAGRVERIAQLMREFDAAAVEDVFSDGLLNVMDAPEFARTARSCAASSGCSRTVTIWATSARS